MWRLPDSIFMLAFASLLVSGCDLAALIFMELHSVPVVPDTFPTISASCMAEHSVFFGSVRSALQQYGLVAVVAHALVVVAGCAYACRYVAAVRHAKHQLSLKVNSASRPDPSSDQGILSNGPHTTTTSDVVVAVSVSGDSSGKTDNSSTKDEDAEEEHYHQEMLKNPLSRCCWHFLLGAMWALTLFQFLWFSATMWSWAKLSAECGGGSVVGRLLFTCLFFVARVFVLVLACQ